MVVAEGRCHLARNPGSNKEVPPGQCLGLQYKTLAQPCSFDTLPRTVKKDLLQAFCGTVKPEHVPDKLDFL